MPSVNDRPLVNIAGQAAHTDIIEKGARHSSAVGINRQDERHRSFAWLTERLSVSPTPSRTAISANPCPGIITPTERPRLCASSRSSPRASGTCRPARSWSACSSLTPISSSKAPATSTTATSSTCHRQERHDPRSGGRSEQPGRQRAITADAGAPRRLLWSGTASGGGRRRLC